MSEVVKSPASIIDSLIGQLKATTDDFPVRIGMIEFRFRYFADGDEWDQAKVAAAQWAKTVKGKTCPADLKTIRVKDAETLVWCSLMGELCLGGTALKRDPATDQLVHAGPLEPVPAKAWLKLAHDQPLGFEHVKDAVNAEITGNVRIQRQEEILEGKDA
ncbi:MAG: hypothetical protein ACO1SV_27670 [Fimbriimonas sp.]